jgi:Bcr/CflA subfamily drug resistance transporter
MKFNSKTNIWLLFIVISVSQFGFSLFLPSLPEISVQLGAPTSITELTVVYYMVGLLVSQLIYGPLSDFYGRRKIMLSGMFIFILGTVLATFSWSIDLLLIARLVQGLGIGAATTIGRAILRDVFQDDEYIKSASKLASFVAVTPVIAPILGGFIQAWLGWRWNFGLLLIFALIVFSFWYFLFYETNKQQNKNSISISLVIKNYLTIFKSPIFLKNAICGGLIYSGEVVFLSVAPFLIQEKLHISVALYGWILFLTVSGFIIGARCSAILVHKFECKKLILIGLFTTLSSSILMIIWSGLSNSSLLSTVVPMVFFMWGAGFVYPNAAVSAIGSFPEKAGVASALLSSLQGLVAASVGFLASAFHCETATDLALILVCLSLVSITLLLLGAIVNQHPKGVIPSAAKEAS